MITEDIGLVVDAVRESKVRLWDTQNEPLTPYYIHGHKLEISNRLLKKDSDKVFKYQKYPLIALKEDIVYDVENDVERYRLNIAILAPTVKTYKSEERDEFDVKPILNPLYDLFLDKLKESGLFFYNGQRPEHTTAIRKYYGMSDGANSYIFNDPLDAIELIDLRLNKRIKCK